MRELYPARSAAQGVPLRRTAALAVAVTVAALAVATVSAAPAGAAVPAATPVVAAVAAAPVAAAGPVSGPGLVQGLSCTPGCDLFAKAGSTVVGGVTLPVWNFTSGDTTVTGANPVIVAQQGASVSITVHNTLSTRLALSVPGIVGLLPDYTGVAAGASKTYTFTAGRPGTFIYQAGRLGGLTDPGPRQVAMGLAGALVVRPTGTPNQALGVPVPASTFDDEAVMVLSEIDPLFAAAPLTYDMRLFRGTYRLVNGAAFPETAQVGTAINHKVLLRYVNAGVSAAPIGPVGLKQSVVALNGYPATGADLVADSVSPGSTEDAIVTMPATPSNVLVIDSTGGLNTNGQVDTTTTTATNTTRQLGFGGRITVLTSAGGLGGTVTPPTSDTVGPVASAVTVTPSPASVTSPVTITATLTDSLVNGYGPSDVDRAELFVDTLGAVGTGTPMTGTFGTPVVTDTTATLSPTVLQALTGGPLHRVYVRGHDSAGNWGAAVSSELNIPNGLPKVTNLSLTPSVTNGSVPVLLAATGDDSSIGGTIASMSYSLDGGPAVPVALNNPAAAVVAGSGTIPASALSGLAAGTHTVVVSAVDAPLGLTGSAGVVLTVDKLGPATSGGKVEPDPTNGTVGSAVDPTSLKVSAAFTDAVGANNPTTSPIVAAEGFVNNPTGVGGQGFVFVAADGAFGSLSEPSAYGLIPLSEVTALPQGTNTVYVHAKDAAGNWGDLTPIQFTVDTVKPTLSTPTAVQTAGGAGRVTVSTTLANPTAPAATAIVAAEYFLGTTDPGAGLGTALPGALTPGPITLSLTGIPVGAQTIVVRVKDAAGNWSVPVSATLTVRSEPIFTDTFGAGNGGNAGNSTAWAARTAGANAPTYPVGTGLGMNTRFVMRSALNSGASFVTTPTMNGADPATGTYYARFLFRPDTLTVTNTGARILSVRSGANTERVGLRYNRANATTSASVCLVVAGVVSTSCANLAVGTTYSLGVKWSPGAGGAQLFVNGVATGAPVNVGTGLTVDRALLGVIGGTGTGIGQAYFDFFTASRFGLPA